MSTGIQKQGSSVAESKPATLKGLLDSPAIKSKLSDILGNKRAATFATSIVQISLSNNLLKNAEPNSIIGAAMTAATLGLPLNNSIGQAYIVPFNERQDDGSYMQKAQFILGYKGLKQLAIRSGQYSNIYSKEVYEGQVIDDDSFLGYRFDWKAKKSDKVIGYASYYKLLNGFESTLYMSSEELTAHGKKFSATFKRNFGNWVDSFDKMALKTVSKLHLNSGEAPLSVDMQTAIQSDQGIIQVDEEGEIQDAVYADTDEGTKSIDPVKERIMNLITSSKNQEDLDFAKTQAEGEEFLDAIKKKQKEINLLKNNK